MDERDTPDPLRDLGQRLDRARRDRGGPAAAPQAGAAADTRGALGLGLRIGVELVVAVAVGGFVGWALDRWLGTRPWGMIVLLFVGIGVGMLNVYRAVMGLGMAMGYKRGDPPPAGGGDDAKCSDDED
jgi:ATP synthase protein I